MTEWVETRERLERQKERLEAIAEFVSEDLRTPLSRATDALSQAREAADSPHLAEVESALGRMRALIEAGPGLDRADQAEPLETTLTSEGFRN
jgi:signal transduction histidine kinase